jgi:hypothetical protein
MNFIKIKHISIILIQGLIFLSGSGSADIIDKEPYSIPSKIQYKDNLYISILPFAGELSEERKYVMDLIKNYLGDNILIYKKIRFPYTFIDLKANAFNSRNKEVSKFKQPEKEKNNDEEIKERFLELKLIEDKTISADKNLAGIDSMELIAVPGTDILISGEVKQNVNNLKIRIKVINNIYRKEFIIEKEGTFKNIDQLMGSLSHEVIKAIIAKYSYVNISSNEKDAAIYIDDRYFGRTDKSGILLESGIHKFLFLKKNYTVNTTTVNLAEKSTASLHIDFSTKDISPMNIIDITTEPDKARVYIDSDFIGLSPIVKNDLPPGIYRVRVEKEGYITKYQTIEVNSWKNNKNEIKNELLVILEKGNSKEYYFSRTSAYNNLFICSSFGIVISSASYLYFGLKVNDQNAKLKNLSTGDPDYAAKKSKIQDRKDKYNLYRQISLYTAGAMIISAGVFYYLDKAQDDVSIAFYFPQKNYYINKSFTNNSSSSLSSIEKGAGIIFTKSF